MTKKALVRSFGWLTGACALAVVTLATITNVATAPDAQDVAVFESKLSLTKEARPLDYEGEIATIRRIQAKVLAVAPLGKGIPEQHSREPVDLVQRGFGLCFDRSRTIDKALQHAGFETRHVFVLYKRGASFWTAITRPRHPSHAVTEVKTSRGWLFVDSNSTWLGVTADGAPVDADNIWKRVEDFSDMPRVLREPSWAIRGMYSRSGRLYPPYIPFPDFNWVDFLRWALA